MRIEGNAISEAGGINAQQTGADKQTQKLKKACQDFEAIFLNNLFKSMRQTVPKSDLFGSTKDEEFFTEMMDSEVAQAASKQKSIGISGHALSSDECERSGRGQKGH